MAIAIIATNIFLYLALQPLAREHRQKLLLPQNNINITVKVTELDNLKIGEGSSAKTIIADRERERERTRLTAQQKQLSYFSHFLFISFQAITLH